MNGCFTLIYIFVLIVATDLTLAVDFTRSGHYCYSRSNMQFVLLLILVLLFAFALHDDLVAPIAPAGKFAVAAI